MKLTDPEQDASEIILNLRPSFTVSWRSTALCESLRHGVVPIALPESRTGRSSELAKNSPYTATDPLFTSWTIYPFKKRTLSWGEEKERIFELLEDTSLYTKTLSELRVR